MIPAEEVPVGQTYAARNTLLLVKGVMNKLTSLQWFWSFKEGWNVLCSPCWCCVEGKLDPKTIHCLKAQHRTASDVEKQTKTGLGQRALQTLWHRKQTDWRRKDKAKHRCTGSHPTKATKKQLRRLQPRQMTPYILLFIIYKEISLQMGPINLHLGPTLFLLLRNDAMLTMLASFHAFFPSQREKLQSKLAREGHGYQYTEGDNMI